MNSHCGHYAIRAGEGDIVHVTRNVAGGKDAWDGCHLHLVHGDDLPQRTILDIAAKVPGYPAVEAVVRGDEQRLQLPRPPSVNLIVESRSS